MSDYPSSVLQALNADGVGDWYGQVLRALQGYKGSNGSLTVQDSHIFSDEAERDSYFSEHLDELVDNLYVVVGGNLQQYDLSSNTWSDVSTIIRGEKGDKGDTGEPGESISITVNEKVSDSSGNIILSASDIPTDNTDSVQDRIIKIEQALESGSLVAQVQNPFRTSYADNGNSNVFKLPKQPVVVMQVLVDDSSGTFYFVTEDSFVVDKDNWTVTVNDISFSATTRVRITYTALGGAL